MPSLRTLPYVQCKSHRLTITIKTTGCSLKLCNFSIVTLKTRYIFRWIDPYKPLSQQLVVDDCLVSCNADIYAVFNDYGRSTRNDTRLHRGVQNLLTLTFGAYVLLFGWRGSTSLCGFLFPYANNYLQLTETFFFFLLFAQRSTQIPVTPTS